MNRKISALIASALLFSTFTMAGCGKKNEEAAQTEASEQALDMATREIRQNDYRGGVTRTYALQKSILNVMETMKQNNTAIRSNSPNSFWTADGYQDFVVNFLNIAIINDTQWFNEEETDWATLTKQMTGVENSFTQPSSDSETGYASKYPSLLITRNEKDDYSVTGINGNWNGSNIYVGNFSYRILYDCDKDWCKAYATLAINADVPNITTELFEYARISDDTFAVQTSTERLLVVLEKAEKDMDIRDRSVKEFYYSKLTSEGARTTFTPFEPKLEYDTETGGYINENARYNERMATYSLMNEKGDLTTRYGVNDSMFLTDDIIKNVNSEWVFDDKSLQQAIIYKDGALVVTTYNKLSEMYERFVYATEGVKDSIIKEIEKMVEIRNLVGIQEMPEKTVQTKPEEKTEDNTETSTDTSSSEEPAVTAAVPETTEETTTTTAAVTVTAIKDTTTPEDAERELANNLKDGDVIYAAE